MYAKKHIAKEGPVVALCDKELIGKVLREGELVLDLKKYSGFYVGEIVGKAKAKEMLKDAISINLVGKKSLALALELKLCKSGEEKNVAGVPHLQIYRL
jgi:uncharacterized protein